MIAVATARRWSGLAAFLLTAQACAEDVAQEADKPRPAHDELLEFYTEFCTHWLGCASNPELSWGSIEECAEHHVEYYEQLPTTCLDRVVTFHECIVESNCDAYVRVPLQPDLSFFVCKSERDAIDEVDCGGISAPG